MKISSKALLLPVLGLVALRALSAAARARQERARTPQVAVITGGARGLGLVFARMLANAGFHVAICSRTKEELMRAKAELEFRYPDIQVFADVCDVGKRAEVNRFIHRVQGLLGPIDLLINNASIIQVGPFEAMAGKDYEASLHCNLWGAINTSLATIPQMIHRRSGRILNITSVGAVVPVPHLVPYSTSKFALFGFSTGMASELRKHGISVTTAIPGLMATGSFIKSLVKGDRRKEFQLFAWAGNSVLTAKAPETAAAAMLNDCFAGKAISVPDIRVKFQRLSFALFPGFVITALDLIARMLPKAEISQAREIAYRAENAGLVDTLARGRYLRRGLKAVQANNEKVA